jgi:hypothetical protein
LSQYLISGISASRVLQSHTDPLTDEFVVSLMRSHGATTRRIEEQIMPVLTHWQQNTINNTIAKDYTARCEETRLVKRPRLAAPKKQPVAGPSVQVASEPGPSAQSVSEQSLAERITPREEERSRRYDDLDAAERPPNEMEVDYS